MLSNKKWGEFYGRLDEKLINIQNGINSSISKTDSLDHKIEEYQKATDKRISKMELDVEGIKVKQPQQVGWWTKLSAISALVAIVVVIGAANPLGVRDINTNKVVEKSVIVEQAPLKD